jgi:hypothetical protein
MAFSRGLLARPALLDCNWSRTTSRRSYMAQKLFQSLTQEGAPKRQFGSAFLGIASLAISCATGSYTLRRRGETVHPDIYRIYAGEVLPNACYILDRILSVPYICQGGNKPVESPLGESP